MSSTNYIVTVNVHTFPENSLILEYNSHYIHFTYYIFFHIDLSKCCQIEVMFPLIVFCGAGSRWRKCSTNTGNRSAEEETLAV